MKNKILKIIFIVFLFSIPQVKGTNSYFTSTEKKISVSITTAADFSPPPVLQILPPAGHENILGASMLMSGLSTELTSTPTIAPTVTDTPTPTDSQMLSPEPSPTAEPTAEPTADPQPTQQEATPTITLE